MFTLCQNLVSYLLSDRATYLSAQQTSKLVAAGKLFEDIQKGYATYFLLFDCNR